MIAEGELFHPPDDEQLDLGNLLQVDEGFLVTVPGRVDRRPAIPDHGTGTELTTSSITMSTLTP